MDELTDEPDEPLTITDEIFQEIALAMQTLGAQSDLLSTV